MRDKTVEYQQEIAALQLENDHIQQQLSTLLETQTRIQTQLWEREQQLAVTLEKLGASEQAHQSCETDRQSAEMMRQSLAMELPKTRLALKTAFLDRYASLQQVSTQKVVQNIVDHLPGMLYQLRQSPNGAIDLPYVSVGCQEIYEFEPARIYHDTALFFNLIHPDDLSDIQRSMARSAKHLIIWEYEYRIMTPAGATKWVRSVARPRREADGTVIWDGYVFDVSEYKAAEVALINSEEKFRRLVENANDVIWMSSLEGKITYLSPKFQEVFGYPIATWMGRTFTALVHPADLSQVVQALRQVAKTAKSLSGVEFRYHRQDQTWAWAMMNVAPVKNAQTKVIGFQGSWRDINDRKLAEQHLQDQARRDALLNRLTAQIRKTLNFDVILQTTLREIQQLFDIDRCGLVTYIQEGDQTYWQLVQEERRPGIAMMPNRFSVSDTNLGKRLRSLQPVEIVDAAMESDPRTRQMFQDLGVRSMLAIPEQLSDEILCVLTCTYLAEARDWSEEEIELLKTVTAQLAIALKQADLYTQSQMKAKELESALQDLKRTQAQMIHSEKMSSLGQMVAGIAHEINNPTNFIYSNLEYTEQYAREAFQLVALYQKHYPTPPPEIANQIESMDLDFLKSDLKKLCHSMQVGAERIREIVNSLRNFSRLDESVFKSADLHEGIDSTIMIVQNRLKSNGMRSEIQLVREYAELPMVECYPGELNQVFLNLLNNAIDALETGCGASLWGTATPNLTPMIQIKTLMDEPMPGWVSVQITDNGVGMPESIQARIFDPFFTTKAVGKGTGLGLSVCYHTIAEQHGGNLRCSSVVGSGSIFVIQIPIQNHNRQHPTIVASTDVATLVSP